MITSIGRFAAKTSIISLALAMTTGAAYAQTKTAPAAATQDEALVEKDIVVTGSSLKGVAPVGSNLTTVGREQLEDMGAQTVQQVLKTVPSIVGSNTAGQGGFGSFDGAGTNAPTIHSLGASASNSTLILLNGHRLPVGGVNHVLADPNIVSPMALERVEVLADGSSSVYGSDAVAGVVNFITRRNVNGIEATIQKGFGKQYGTFNAGVLAGKTWDTGSILFSYNYSNRSNLNAANRAFTVADHRPFGGTNQQTLSTCSPAVIVAGGLTYLTPSSTGVSNAQALLDAAANPSCDKRSTWDIIPSEVRHNALVSIKQDVGDSLTLTGDFIYSNRKTRQNISRGSAASKDIWGSGAPAGNSNNPFFVAPTASGLTTEKVTFDADALLGAGAHIDGTAETLYGRLDADYKISDDWNLNLGMVYGRDTSRVENIGQLCGSCYELALNGKTVANVGGVPTTSTLVLTAANAVDVFGNGTSAATKAYLADSRQFTNSVQQIVNLYGKVDGDIFQLPAGAAKIAIGGEYTRYTLSQDKVSPTNLGPSSTNSAFLHLDYSRNVKSAYAELFVPIIGPEQGIPGIRRFDLNISGRIDDYSDFGSTTNPKIAANWEVVEGVKLRGNWGKSFVAPALTSRGANAAGQTAESIFSYQDSTPTNTSFDIPYSAFPTAVNIPGCLPASTTVTSCTVGNAARPGIQVSGGSATLKPQKGESWSLGVDLAPTFAPGLRMSLTYWNNKLRGGVTAPTAAFVTSAPDLNYLLAILPTAAQITSATAGLPQSNPATTNVYYIISNQQSNVVNLDVAGIDFDASYRLETENAGKFTFGAGFTRKLKFDAAAGSGPKFDALGTAGIFTTFQAIKFEGRANIGWDYKGFNANVAVSHTGGYTNRGIPTTTLVTAVTKNAAGFAVGGGDAVGSFTSVDLNLSYTLKDVSIFKSAQFFVDATNVFDKAPSFLNAYSVNGTSNGYDSGNGNPIGRVVTIGLRTKF